LSEGANKVLSLASAVLALEIPQDPAVIEKIFALLGGAILGKLSLGLLIVVLVVVGGYFLLKKI
jgi:hypothetical protein